MVDPLSLYAPVPRRRPHAFRDAVAVLALGLLGVAGILDGTVWFARHVWLFAVAVAS